MKDYLPLGSVVLLESAKKSLIIIGTMQVDDMGNEYDYISCAFPEGYIDDETFFLFNEEDIREVKFIGCVNSETQVYTQALKEVATMQNLEDADMNVDNSNIGKEKSE